MDIYLDPNAKIPKSLQRRSRLTNTHFQQPQYQNITQSNYQLPQQFQKSEPLQNSPSQFIQNSTYNRNSNAGRFSLLSNSNTIQKTQKINQFQGNLTYNQYNPFNTLDKFHQKLANNCSISIIVFYIFIYLFDLLVLCAHDYYKTGGDNILYLDMIFLNLIKILILYFIVQTHWTEDIYEFDSAYIRERIFLLNKNIWYLFIIRGGLIIAIYYFFQRVIKPYYDPLNFDVASFILFITLILTTIKMFIVNRVYDQEFYDTSFMKLKHFLKKFTRDYIIFCFLMVIICFVVLVNNEDAYNNQKNVFTFFELKMSIFIEEIFFILYYFCFSFYLHFYLSRYAKIPNVLKVAKQSNLVFKDMLQLLQQCSQETKKSLFIQCIEFQITEHMIQHFSFFMQNKFNITAKNNVIAMENIKLLITTFNNDIKIFQQALDFQFGKRSLNRSQLVTQQSIFSFLWEDKNDLKKFFYLTYQNLQIQMRKIFLLNSISRNFNIYIQIDQISYDLKNYFDTLENVYHQLSKEQENYKQVHEIFIIGLLAIIGITLIYFIFKQ